MSRERKLFALILCLALAGLAVDRLVLGSDGTGPARAGAALLAAQTPLAPAPSAPELANPDAADRTSVWQQLQNLGQNLDVDLAQVPNAFDAAWAQHATRADDDLRPTARPFQQDRRLTAVLALGQAGYAIIDGKTLKLGQAIDGHRLVAVTQRSATLAAPDGSQVVLTLAGDPAAASATP